ncbi:alpha/beta fold hydrolase [Mycobacterium sp. 2YAF39]|uniref:alpha/beta fold hydrolase n=1 Tax=Mycobacterium sp. 2YAF39 TaxID=3233033 RepID=UPI003F96A76D
MNPTCVVDGAVIDYEDTGAGSVVVFVHGVYVSGAIWHRVVAAIGGSARCIVPTWPLGAHEPVRSGVDLSAAATARRIIGFLEALDLQGVTLVANDTGGGLVLAALGDPALDSSRIGSLVFTNCDSYEHFPPGQFRVLVKLCQISPRLGSAVLWALSTKPGLSVFLKAVCKQPVTDAEKSAIFGAFLTDSATRRQAAAVTASLDPALTLRAVPAIKAFSGPVTLVWAAGDPMFPLDHGRRLAADFPNSQLIEISESLTYVMLDAPGPLAEAITSMVSAS